MMSKTFESFPNEPMFYRQNIGLSKKLTNFPKSVVFVSEIIWAK